MRSPRRNDRLVADALATVNRNALRLLKLVNTLLDFARIEAGRAEANYEPTDSAAFTERSRRRISIGDRVGRTAVRGALRAARRAGRCRSVDVGEDRVQPPVERAQVHARGTDSTVRSSASGDAVGLSVADTGTGIAADQLPHVFERFHRVRGAAVERTKGPVLGWHWCRRSSAFTAERSPSTVRAGVGTIFTVNVPISAHSRGDRADRRAASGTVDVGERRRLRQ